MGACRLHVLVQLFACCSVRGRSSSAAKRGALRAPECEAPLRWLQLGQIYMHRIVNLQVACLQALMLQVVPSVKQWRTTHATTALRLTERAEHMRTCFLHGWTGSFPGMHVVRVTCSERCVITGNTHTVLQDHTSLVGQLLAGKATYGRRHWQLKSACKGAALLLCCHSHILLLYACCIPQAPCHYAACCCSVFEATSYVRLYSYVCPGCARSSADVGLALDNALRRRHDSEPKSTFASSACRGEPNCSFAGSPPAGGA